MSDQSTTIADLKALIDEFVEARDWSRFHAPKNLSMALAIEAAELMEHFQWVTPEASRALAGDDAKLEPIREELADVFAYCLALASELGVDMSMAVRDKMVKNKLKYPADEFRGRYERDDPS